MSMNVAVLSTPQHSKMFGQRASWHTVLRCLSSMSFAMPRDVSLSWTRTFSHSGRGVIP